MVPSARTAAWDDGAYAVALAARTAGADLVRFAEDLRAVAVAFALAVFRRFTGFAALDCDDLAVRCPRSPSFDEFLRDFLDIRLPFVAFRGSTIGVLRVSSPASGFVSVAGQF